MYLAMFSFNILNIHIIMELFPKERFRLGFSGSGNFYKLLLRVYSLKISEAFELLKFPKNQLSLYEMLPHMLLTWALSGIFSFWVDMIIFLIC